MHIALASDDNFVMQLATAVRSVLDTTAPDHQVQLSVLSFGISEINKRRLLESWQSDRLSVDFIDGAAFPVLQGLVLPGKHISSMTIYACLLLPQALPNAPRVLYLDADLVAVEDISPLWDMDLAGDELAACLDPGIPTASSEGGIDRWRYHGLPADMSYANTGVMLLDLDAIRRARTFESAFVYLKTEPSVNWYAQEAINFAIRGNFRQLARQWNLTFHAFVPPWGTLTSLPPNTKIRHFAGRVKPWSSHVEEMYEKNNIGGDLFYMHLDRTSWKGWRPSA